MPDDDFSSSSLTSFSETSNWGSPDEPFCNTWDWAVGPVTEPYFYKYGDNYDTYVYHSDVFHIDLSDPNVDGIRFGSGTKLRGLLYMIGANEEVLTDWSGVEGDPATFYVPTGIAYRPTDKGYFSAGSATINPSSKKLIVHDGEEAIEFEEGNNDNDGGGDIQYLFIPKSSSSDSSDSSGTPESTPEPTSSISSSSSPENAPEPTVSIMKQFTEFTSTEELRRLGFVDNEDVLRVRFAFIVTGYSYVDLQGFTCESELDQSSFSSNSSSSTSSSSTSSTSSSQSGDSSSSVEGCPDNTPLAPFGTNVPDAQDCVATGHTLWKRYDIDLEDEALDADCPVSSTSEDSQQNLRQLPTYYAINGTGQPSSSDLGMIDTRYAFHGFADPSTWETLANSAVDEGIIWANVYEPNPEEWASFCNGVRGFQPSVEVGIYNQNTRDYWKSREHWKQLVSNFGAPNTIAGMRSHIAQYGPLINWPERAAMQAHPNYELFYEAKLQAYDAWTQSVDQFCNHADNRVSAMDYVWQSVYLFYNDANQHDAYIYAYENLYWHTRNTSVPIIATIMPDYHSDPGTLTEPEVRAIAQAAKDAGCKGLSMWTGDGAWNSNDANVANWLVDEGNSNDDYNG
jgi:hypothetical protein